MSAPQYGRTNKDNYSAAHKHKPSAASLLLLTLPSLPMKCTLGERELFSKVQRCQVAWRGRVVPYSRYSSEGTASIATETLDKGEVESVNDEGLWTRWCTFNVK